MKPSVVQLHLRGESPLPRAMEIIRAHSVIGSVINLLASEKRQKPMQVCLGILSNLCQSSQFCELFIIIIITIKDLCGM
jgi:hypothetical protein